mgnify:CR=1 FL=1
MNGLIQPQAIELESIILGAILLESEAYGKACQIINADSFYLEKNQIIFECFNNINKDNLNIDTITLIEYLKKVNKLDYVGGMLYVAELTSTISSSANIEQHARIIKEKELRRELITLAHESIKKAYDNTSDVFDNLINLSLQTSTLLDNNSTKEVEKLNDLIVFNHKDRLIEKIGQKSKFENVPDYEKGKLIIMAGRPAMGKTTFAINEAYHFSKDNTVGFFSLEMTANEIATKIESLESRIPMQRLTKNKIYSNETEKYDNLKRLNTKLFIDDTPAITLQNLKAKAVKMKKKHGLNMIVIDYLQLMKGDNKGNREQEISSITRGLKELAKALEIPIIALSQLSRAVESRQNKRPMLSDLRESGSIEQDADMVGFLFRPYYYAEQSGDANLMQQTDKDAVDYIIAKNRGGMCETIELSCDLSISEFRDKESISGGDFIEEDPNF